jgi:hypothetical protein
MRLGKMIARVVVQELLLEEGRAMQDLRMAVAEEDVETRLPLSSVHNSVHAPRLVALLVVHGIGGSAEAEAGVGARGGGGEAGSKKDD